MNAKVYLSVDYITCFGHYLYFSKHNLYIRLDYVDACSYLSILFLIFFLILISKYE